MRDPGRRALAARLFESGTGRAEAARTLGVSLSTVDRWRRMHQSAGTGGLLSGAPRGRPPRLSPRERAAIDRAILDPPRRHGFPLDDWTLAAVALLVERLTGKRYHRRHMTRLLKGLGWIVPPLGPNAARALRRRSAVDPEGNPLLILAVRGRGS